MRQEPFLRTADAMDLAHLAAVLLKDGRSVGDAVRLALELADAADFAVTHAYAPERDSGVTRFEERGDLTARRKAFEQKLPKFTHEIDGHGKKLPAPFEEALRLLMPRLKASDRRRRFAAWLGDYYQDWNAAAVKKEITRLEKFGFSAQFFTVVSLSLPEWQRKKTSRSRAEAGKKGAVSSNRKKSLK